MRVLELTAHVQIIRRKDGRSATAAAAYRACDRIECEREGVVHDYRRKQGLEASGLVMPSHAPDWLQSRSALWNAAELRERNGARGPNAGAWRDKATVAREIVFGFPAELSADGRLRLAAQVARHMVETYGVACDLSLHEPGKLGDRRNHHAHLLMTTRRVTAKGLGTKAREWDGHHAGSRTVSEFRAFLAGAMNQALAEEGHGDAVHVEHRSYKARGLATVPTKHQGPGRTNAKRVRQARERQEWERNARQAQAGRQAAERAEQAQRQASRGVAKLRDVDAREARALATEGANGRAADLRAGFQAERDRFGADQAREVRELADRHQADDRQLDRAASFRTERDRIAEATDRRQEVERRGHELNHDHDRERVRI